MTAENHESQLSVIAPDTFWGVTVLYNSEGYQTRRSTYTIFRERSRKQGLRLLAVELAFGDGPFELKEGDADLLVQLRSSDEAIMWQKERLLNVALNHLPPDCNAFAWLDCDVIFENDRWIEETVALLRRHVVVQPFAISVRLPKGRTTTMDIALANDRRFERRPSIAYAREHAGPAEDFVLTGHSGFAWAARRSIFDGLGFYDKMIVGGGDTVLMCGFFGRPTHKFTHILPEPLVQDQQAWIQMMSSRVGGRVGFTPGAIFHLWHGESKRRRTQERLEILHKHRFDPQIDVRTGDAGQLLWSGNKPALQRAVARYFWLRNEDGDRMRERWFEACDRARRWWRKTRARVALRSGELRTRCAKASLSIRGLPERAKLTLVIMNWKRPEMVRRIVETYSRYSFIGEIVLWDNNWDGMTDLPRGPKLKTVSCRYDAGLDSRWAACALAQHEHVLVHDDDLILAEEDLRLLFRRYLGAPHLCHGVAGRNFQGGRYVLGDSYGRVDIVITPCMIFNERYVDEYFKRIALFDDLRSYHCGNGEDIVMNYVVRSLTGQRNLAHRIPFTNFAKASGIANHAISARPRHLSVRTEIARRCEDRLLGGGSRIAVDTYGIEDLSRLFPPVWPLYFRSPEDLLRSENFSISANVDLGAWARALSYLTRRPVRLPWPSTRLSAAHQSFA